MQAVLEPLLEDFQHWFQRSLDLLEAESIAELSSSQQASLIDQVRIALGEVRTTHTLLEATDGQAGVAADKVMAWHRLVHQCWAIAYRHRRAKSSES